MTILVCLLATSPSSEGCRIVADVGHDGWLKFGLALGPERGCEDLFPRNAFSVACKTIAIEI
jgi:hypothetical protein